jgi:hypothetical protein
MSGLPQSDAWPIPDKGQPKFYNNTAEPPYSAPDEPFQVQNGNSSINPLPYNKLDAPGTALPDIAISRMMILDIVAGLILENKTSDGSIHDCSKTFP